MSWTTSENRGASQRNFPRRARTSIESITIAPQSRAPMRLISRCRLGQGAGYRKNIPPPASPSISSSAARMSCHPREASVSFEAFRRFAEIANDQNRWVHKIPESPDWALAVQTLGRIPSYRDNKLHEPKMSRGARLCARHRTMRKSMELADSTLVVPRVALGICAPGGRRVLLGLQQRGRGAVMNDTHLRCTLRPRRRASACGAVPLRGRFIEARRAVRRRGHAAASTCERRGLRKVPAERLSERRGSMSDSHLPNLAIAQSPRARHIRENIFVAISEAERGLAIPVKFGNIVVQNHLLILRQRLRMLL